MASSNQCPPAVLLATEAKAELNAGLIIVTGHIPIEAADVDMDQATPEAGMPSVTAPSSSPSNAPAPKARRIAPPCQPQNSGGLGHRTPRKPSQLPSDNRRA